MCLCCGGSSKTGLLSYLEYSRNLCEPNFFNSFDSDEVGMKKKTDEPTPDDPHNSSDESEETEEEQLDEGDEEPPKLENEVCYILEFRLDNIPI